MTLYETGAATVRPAQMAGRVRLLIASSFGTIIEWYDFAVFAVCATLVFNTAFFPNDNPMAGMIAALATQAVGFVARPLGGWFFGMLGDRIGRKRSLVLSLTLMGVSTVAMGLLPVYAQVGILAPILLLILRLLQGFAVGGEATGALVMIAESLPANRRGLWTGFPMVGGPAGNVLATALIGLLIGSIGMEQFVAWGWRIPFLVSIVLIVVGYWMRRRIEESPAFVAMQAEKVELPHAPLREAMRTNGADMLRVFFVQAGENTLFYLFSTFFIVVATVYLHAPRTLALNALMIGSIVEVAAILLSGFVADRIGRRAVTLFGLIGGVVAGYLLFSLPEGATHGQLVAATILTLSFHGCIVGGMSAYFTELFPARVRYTAMSTAYSVASVLGGALAPIVGAWILEATGTPFAVALYATAMAIPAVFVMVTSRETRGLDLQSH